MAFSTGLSAQATLSVQGVLTKSDGTAVDDDTYTVTFKLYDAPTGGNAVHSEPIDVETIGGVYSVILGKNPSYPLTASFNTIYYLGVMVGSSELQPRPQLTHAPYALSLLGQNNKFPSTGPVTADALTVEGHAYAAAFKANGGAPTGGVTNNGFSFKDGSGGDPDGGLFSTGENNVGLYANATKALEASSGGVTIPGSLTAGTTTTNGNQTVNGSQTVNGNQTVTGAVTTGNLTANGSATVSGTGQVNGKVLSGLGYSFTNDGAFDSGMFSGGDGVVRIMSNGQIAAQFSQPESYTNNCCATPSAVRFFGVQKGPDKPQVEWDPSTGQLQVDNSSRRLKRNIQPWAENYKLILKAQPKLYNRIGYPDTLVELGYIAEEFDSIGLKRLVHYVDGQIFGVNYQKVAIFLTEVVKDHETALEEMKAEIAALKAENAALAADNAGLRTLQTQQSTAFSAQLEALSKRMNALENSGAQQERK